MEVCSQGVSTSKRNHSPTDRSCNFSKKKRQVEENGVDCSNTNNKGIVEEILATPTAQKLEQSANDRHVKKFLSDKRKCQAALEIEDTWKTKMKEEEYIAGKKKLAERRKALQEEEQQKKLEEKARKEFKEKMRREDLERKKEKAIQEKERKEIEEKERKELLEKKERDELERQRVLAELRRGEKNYYNKMRYQERRDSSPRTQSRVKELEKQFKAMRGETKLINEMDDVVGPKSRAEIRMNLSKIFNTPNKSTDQENNDLRRKNGVIIPENPKEPELSAEHKKLMHKNPYESTMYRKARRVDQKTYDKLEASEQMECIPHSANFVEYLNYRLEYLNKLTNNSSVERKSAYTFIMVR